MLPKYSCLISQCGRFPKTINYPIAVPKIGCRCANMSNCCGIIPRQCLVLVLIAVDVYRDVLEISGHVLDLCAVDQLLTFQYAAEQQTDNHQYDGDFNQGKTGLIAFHCVNLLYVVLRACT